MAKRATINWHRIEEKQPEAMGLYYLLTVKAWPREDPWHRQPWDGESVAVVFDKWIPGGRPHIVHGQWWSVKESEVIAWAELPKPYEEKGEQVKRNAASKQQADKPKRKKASK